MVNPRDPELLEFWITACSALAGNPLPHDSAGCLDRRLAPRPLPAHLASTAMLWLSSRAALPVSPPSNVSGKQLLDLTPEFDALETERVERAVAIEVAHRTEHYLAGLDA
jgi:hypothetical protein